NGEYQRQFGANGTDDGQFQYIHSIAVGDGKTYVISQIENNYTIQVFSTEGLFLYRLEQQISNNFYFYYPHGITVDNEGNVYVADSNNYRVIKLNAQNELIAIWGHQGTDPGQLQYPRDVEVDPNGIVYVADHRNIISFEISSDI
ncbi:SBBP repeat-containing protein, partial [Reichenbachiella sp.]|uniref:SBBP repeat-containing protein n=2 Tax=Reichenbachiella sp. TaxID=2184521 RepID=UPI0032975719